MDTLNRRTPAAEVLAPDMSLDNACIIRPAALDWTGEVDGNASSALALESALLAAPIGRPPRDGFMVLVEGGGSWRADTALRHAQLHQRPTT